MFVCLCMGVTSHVVNEVVASGATTSKQISEACGAGGDCGRCRRTLRSIIAAHREVDGCPSKSVSRPKTTASEDRSETRADGASRKLPPEARTGASGSRGNSR